jgi:hypothetical protein
MWRLAPTQQKKSNKINAKNQKFLLPDWKPLLPFFEGASRRANKNELSVLEEGD